MRKNNQRKMIAVPADLHADLSIIAKQDNRTVGNMVSTVLRLWVFKKIVRAK